MNSSHLAQSVASSRSVAGTPVRVGKLPPITPLFWVLTVLAAGMGQAVADWLIGTGDGLPGLGLGGALGIEAGLFVLALALEFAVRFYVPPVYWLAVIGVSVFGTLVPDVMHFAIGIPSWALPPIYALVLAVNFWFWYRAERSLSINTIPTRRREVSYWVTVLLIFALGTSFVDLVTLEWHVGSLAAAIGFFVVILAIGSLFTRFRGAVVPLFWSAYVISRPLAGSLSDWLIHDVGLGAGTVTLAGSVLIVVLVGSSMVAHCRTSRQHGAARDAIAEPTDH